MRKTILITLASILFTINAQSKENEIEKTELNLYKIREKSLLIISEPLIDLIQPIIEILEIEKLYEKASGLYYIYAGNNDAEKRPCSLDQDHFIEEEDSCLFNPIDHSHPSNEYEIEDDVYEQVNAYRLSLNLPPLSYNEKIAAVAREHSKNMAQHIIDIGHGDFQARSDRVRALTHGRNVGENIAAIGTGSNEVPMAIEG